jgi:hypothetical protein
VAQAQCGTTQLSGSGVIERRLDRDVFSFSAAAGPASINLQLPSAGTYFVVVDGAGQGEVQGTGYSDDGSLDQYSISGTVPSP